MFLRMLLVCHLENFILLSGRLGGRYQQASVPGRRRKRSGERSRASRHLLVLPEAQNILLDLTRIDRGGFTSAFSGSKPLLRPVPLGEAMYERR